MSDVATKVPSKVLTTVKGAMPKSRAQIIGTSAIGVLSAGIGFVAGRLSKKTPKESK